MTNEIIPVEDMYGDVTKEVIIDKELKCKVIDLRRDQDTRPQPAQETTPTRPGPSQGPCQEPSQGPRQGPSQGSRSKPRPTPGPKRPMVKDIVNAFNRAGSLKVL